MSPMLNEKIFREYDIRGIAGIDLDRDVAVLIGKAFASFLIDSNTNAKCVSAGTDKQ